MNKCYEIGRGYSNFVGDWDDCYILAKEEAEIEMDEKHEGIIEWLDENLKDGYELDEEYDHDYSTVTCIIVLVFSSIENELAFKLRWL